MNGGYLLDTHILIWLLDDDDRLDENIHERAWIKIAG